MIPAREDLITEPLPVALGEIAGLWLLASLGYYFLFPALGISQSYNAAPIAIAFYYFGFAWITLFYFWRLFLNWMRRVEHVWLYLGLSAICAGLVWSLLFALSKLPEPSVLSLGPSADILFATPWYFLPKSAEVLVQQLLVAVLVLQLYERFGTLRRTIVAYAATFGGAHILLYVLNGAPTAYASIMTLGAFASSLAFPYLYLRVRAGFVYAFTIHLLFYILLALALHAWPPPGFIA